MFYTKNTKNLPVTYEGTNYEKEVKGGTQVRQSNWKNYQIKYIP